MTFVVGSGACACACVFIEFCTTAAPWVVGGFEGVRLLCGKSTS